MRWVAFLRGINVGGHKAIAMADLQAAFEAMGFSGVTTVQASGNVVFEAGEEETPAGLAARIEQRLADMFGGRTRVAVRRMVDLEDLVGSDPFAAVSVTPATRLYVTFLSHPAPNGKGLSDERIRLARVGGEEVLTAIELAPGWGTTELMRLLEKTFGREVTTRNWNTILKLVAG
jgi:uncharacterized protein (DUF1697 family)